MKTSKNDEEVVTLLEKENKWDNRRKKAVDSIYIAMFIVAVLAFSYITFTNHHTPQTAVDNSDMLK